MRNLNIKTFNLLILFLCLVFNSCKKNVAGPQGDKGTPGGKGNLNQFERTFTIYPNSWTFNGGWYENQIYFPEITNDVMLKGGIKVYMKIGTQWWSLPYVVGDVFMEQTTQPGLLHLKLSKIHNGPPPAPLPTVFRVVVYSPV